MAIKKATTKKATAKKAVAKKATAKRSVKAAPVAGTDTKKLERQLARIEAQLLKFKKEQTELKKDAREIVRVQKQLDKADLELENFKDWTRSYFEQIQDEFNKLATGGKVTLARSEPVVARDSGQLRAEFDEIRHWVRSSLEELTHAIEAVRQEEQTTRSNVDQLRNNWQPVGWHDVPPGVL